MQVEEKRAVGAGVREKSHNRAAGNRHARSVFSILSVVAEIRRHERDAASGRVMGGFGQKRHLQDIFRRRVCLIQNEDVAVADILQNLHPHFAIVESRYQGLPEHYPEFFADSLSKGLPGTSCEYFERPVSHGGIIGFSYGREGRMRATRPHKPREMKTCLARPRPFPRSGAESAAARAARPRTRSAHWPPHSPRCRRPR